MTTNRVRAVLLGATAAERPNVRFIVGNDRIRRGRMPGNRGAVRRSPGSSWVRRLPRLAFEDETTVTNPNVIDHGRTL